MSIKLKDLQVDNKEYFNGYTQEMISDEFNFKTKELEIALEEFDQANYNLTAVIRCHNECVRSGNTQVSLESINELYPSIKLPENFLTKSNEVDLSYTLEDMSEIISHIIRFIIKHLGVILALVAGVVGALILMGGSSGGGGGGSVGSGGGSVFRPTTPTQIPREVIDKFLDKFNTPLDAVIINTHPHNPTPDTLAVILVTANSIVQLNDPFLESLFSICDSSPKYPPNNDSVPTNFGMSPSRLTSELETMRNALTRFDLITIPFTKLPYFKLMPDLHSKSVYMLRSKYFDESTLDLKYKPEEEYDKFWKNVTVTYGGKEYTTKHTDVNYYHKRVLELTANGPGFSLPTTIHFVNDLHKVLDPVNYERRFKVVKEQYDTFKTGVQIITNLLEQTEEVITKLDYNRYINAETTADKKLIVWPKHSTEGTTMHHLIIHKELMSPTILTTHTTAISDLLKMFIDLSKPVNRMLKMRKFLDNQE